MFGPNAHENFALRALRSLSMGGKFRKCCKRVYDVCRKDATLEDSKIKKLKASKIASAANETSNQFEEIEYSSGESEPEIKERFKYMDEDQKFERIVELWCVTIAKAKGAV